ncbi:hypothetical protein HDU87_002571 [Geranomyces variabilis]|uniref:Sfi1 spindle body domain-containing protein n=1 Tax=Geranomyces variabilis TaxID=109894 RepID=A0AAD5TTF3_9FUNG|nr:hypothetical protein HDU87_002571 [Geranomyces variabilis]
MLSVPNWSADVHLDDSPPPSPPRRLCIRRPSLATTTSTTTAEWSDEPHDQSNYFSADRHHARVSAQAWAAPGNNSGKEAWNATEALVFENIVAESTDEVMIEARALLTNWMSNVETNGAGDDASGPIRGHLHEDDDLENRLCAATQRGQVKEIVEDALQFGAGKTAYLAVRPPSTDAAATTTKARHALAQERRENARRARADEVERRIALKQAKALEGLQKKKEIRARNPAALDPNAWKMDVAVRAARAAIDEELARKREAQISVRQKEVQKLTDSVVDEEYSRIRSSSRAGNRVRPTPSACATPIPPTIDEDPAPAPAGPTEVDIKFLAAVEDEARRAKERREEATRVKLEKAHARAEALYSIARLKTLKAHVSAWHKRVCDQKDVMEELQVASRWRLLNRAMQVWADARRRRESHRAAAEVARQLKHAQETALRAVRFHRATLLSKAFVGWTAWTRIEQETRRTRIQHEERAARMKEVLSRLTKKQELIEHVNEKRVQGILVEATDARNPTVEGPQNHVQPTEQTTAPPTAVSTDDKDPETAPTAVEPEQPKVERKARGPLRTARDQQLITEMEKRQQERQERRAALQAAREQHQKELAEAKAREEAEAIQRQHDEKIRLRNERKALEAAHQAARAAAQALAAKIDTFRAKWILHGVLGAWIEFRRVEERRAEAFWTAKWGRAWGAAWRARCEAREDVAIMHWTTAARIKFWTIWQTARRRSTSRKIRAEEHCVKLARRFWLAKWRAAYVQVSTRRIAKEAASCARADVLAQRLVPKRYFRDWRAYVLAEKERKWREYRKQVLRDRVKEILHNSHFEAKLQLETISGQDGELSIAVAAEDCL